MRKILIIFGMVLALAVLFTACGKEVKPQDDENKLFSAENNELTAFEEESTNGLQTPVEEANNLKNEDPEVPENPKTQEEPKAEQTGTPELSSADAEPSGRDSKGIIVAIDPGHQGKGNPSKEPIGPGATEQKAKVTSGTQGRTTGVPEHKVNLEVSLKLKDELISRGYTVIMTRETEDVDISNSERAAIANEAKADAFVRIHCNGSESEKTHGALTMCQTKNNKYCDIYAQSRRLADSVLEGLCAETGAKNNGVQETDMMSGINWCKVPVTIVEMGFMTNPDEDKLLCSEEYQKKLAKGIADGIDLFFETQ